MPPLLTSKKFKIKTAFKHLNINQMFDKIQMILIMKTSISNNRISRLNSYNKNYKIVNQFRQNPRRYVYCFDCKMALRPFTFSKGAILPRVDYEAAVKLEITYIGEVPWIYLTLTSITVPSHGQSFTSCLDLLGY